MAQKQRWTARPKNKRKGVVKFKAKVTPMMLAARNNAGNIGYRAHLSNAALIRVKVKRKSK